MGSTWFYIDFKCANCGKIGHLCRSKKATAKPVSLTNYVEHKERQEQSDDSVLSQEDDSSYSLFSLSSSSQSSDPYTVTLGINGLDILMEIDTGASLSVITFDKLCSAEEPVTLEKSSVILKTYSGESLPVLGEVVVRVTHESQVVDLPVLVIKGNGPWRDWLAKLAWHKVYQLTTSDRLQKLLEKYPLVFDGELGVHQSIYMYKKESNPSFSSLVGCRMCYDKRLKHNCNARRYHPSAIV